MVPVSSSQLHCHSSPGRMHWYSAVWKFKRPAMGPAQLLSDHARLRGANAYGQLTAMYRIDDARSREEPHFIFPGFVLAIFNLDIVIIDQV